jgi:hypothetical protein
MAQGKFVGIPVATLTSLRDKYITCLEAIAVAGASYSIAGRTFSRANLAEVSDTLAELNYAILIGSKQKVFHTYAKFGPVRSIGMI